MENINNIDLIIGLVNQFPKDLTEKSKLNKLNEELEKKVKGLLEKQLFTKLKDSIQIYLSLIKRLKKKQSKNLEAIINSFGKSVLKFFLKEKKY